MEEIKVFSTNDIRTTRQPNKEMELEPHLTSKSKINSNRATDLNLGDLILRNSYNSLKYKSCQH